MSEPKLKARLFVHAAIRRCDLLGMSAVVARRGDADAGTIVVKAVRRDGTAEVFTQVRDAEGRLAWFRATGPEPVPEDRADAYIRRAADVDSDLWVIDVDCPDGQVPFIESIVRA
ncbi:DUF1491 family protein [Magnetospirillum sp. UT-4]|uniref:DUF1491 family protein n=1 Tax=Magnetospirillum sp. UT-4 TaxID=2681467 RepID=UPI001380ECF4|nr:DUF1491 family protein [Magnetospirillum sp. UT-4]CAA7618558.1 conserved hypothetical protein [Magnetospirillum sp. UT-4]